MSYQSLTRTLPLAIALFLLVSYNFISAQWTNAPASPPLNNAAIPVNLSATNQVKLGGLGTGNLSVVGDIGLTNGDPSVLLSDTNGINMWLYNNASWFYLLADRTNDGAWDSPHPMQVFVSATSSNLDWARFSNQIRVDQYCDFAGANCVTPAQMTAAVATPTFYYEVGEVRVHSFNANVVGSIWPAGAIIIKPGLGSNMPSSYRDVTFTSTNYDACFITTNFVSARNDFSQTGAGGCELTWENPTTGEWRLRAHATGDRAATECKASCIGW